MADMKTFIGKILGSGAGHSEKPSVKGLYADSRARIRKGVKIIPPVRLYGEVTVSENAQIGKYTNIGTRTLVAPGATIGNYCSISRDVEIGAANHPLEMLSTHSFQYNERHFPMQEYKKHKRIRPGRRSSGPTRIGNDVWLGAKSIVMRGVTIGDGAVIGGGAIVTRDVPPFAIAVGIPARVKRYRFEPDVVDQLLALRWWRLDPLDMDGVTFDNVTEAIEQLTDIIATAVSKNARALSGVISNNASGSLDGIIWVKTPYGKVDPAFFSRGMALDVTEVNREILFKGKTSALEKGNYLISRAEFDEPRGWYRIEIASPSGDPYRGPLCKDSVSFRIGCGSVETTI
jgi:acetyltransferase-like isoleucine patch superfamily enzyme